MRHHPSLTSVLRVHLRRIAVLATVVVASACVRGNSGGTSVHGSNEVISRAEIAKTQAQTAYDAVQKLRPAFLRSRGATSLLLPAEQEPVVYLDDRRMGGVSFLRDIPVADVFEIRYLSAAQAQLRWGSGHASGVIQVISVKG
jgi:outer membrane cobalamin receptor